MVCLLISEVRLMGWLQGGTPANLGEGGGRENRAVKCEACCNVALCPVHASPRCVVERDPRAPR